MENVTINPWKTTILTQKNHTFDKFEPCKTKILTNVDLNPLFWLKKNQN